ncbi:Prolipoprotein diacylglyceryl transferase [Candidatus Izimaplasma bacterium HR1]|jgi:phosphatidylglycerol:prolipoprotein diacylglycerol transferase|uniref:prolipoprotein diacylglyceryl transferase n=1 Tax=Candidatus Izimoplasma sp. HR1 TaxID=1541959 RepID=UPI0004F5C132|nr:Prolipoprotein diacylglyceryl transferase [Candidatus Izimaplasma bacterium HR1]
MYPFLLPEIFKYSIPLYDVLLAIGIIAMFIYIINRFEKTDGFSRSATNRLIILISISLVFALIFSFLLDGIWHSIKEGELTFGSVTFLGGLIGGLSTFLILMKYFYKEGIKDLRKIMNTVIVGVVLAHAFGRIGCFLAGCCFGIPTDSFLGVIFPHGHASQVFPGETVYPTQLFEAFFLFTLFIGLDRISKFKTFEIETYLIGYGIWRILIEFIRGDDRGSVFTLFTTEYKVFPTPSQFISVFMIGFGIYLIIRRKKDAKI